MTSKKHARNKAQALLDDIEKRLRNGETPRDVENDVAKVYRLLNDAGLSIFESVLLVNRKLRPAISAAKLEAKNDHHHR